MNKKAQAEIWHNLITWILVILGLLVGIYITYLIFSSGAFDPGRIG